jgi:hypothetical protein
MRRSCPGHRILLTAVELRGVQNDLQHTSREYIGPIYQMWHVGGKGELTQERLDCKDVLEYDLGV